MSFRSWAQKLSSRKISQKSRAVPLLKGCEVNAWDLRGGAALVAAGLMAEGTTIIQSCEYIMRGYEDICRDLSGMGACIRYME